MRWFYDAWVHAFTYDPEKMLSDRFEPPAGSLKPRLLWGYWDR